MVFIKYLDKIQFMEKILKYFENILKNCVVVRIIKL